MHDHSKHNHDHQPGCSCGEDKANTPPALPTGIPDGDTATQSLQDALRKTFVILKGIMAILVIWFLTSGIFSVQENEKALILRFGKIRPYGTEGSLVLDSGLKWTWPAPISEIIKIPTTKKTVEIDDFWYYMTDAEKLDPSKMSPVAPDTLSPLKDGYCLTRSESEESLGGIDYNLVHCRWQLTYQIAKPDQFFKNMYHRVPGPGAHFMDVVAESIHPLLKSMAAEAIVHTLVQTSIDEAIVSKEDIRSSVENLLQKKLDAIDSGIKIDSVLPLGKITWPRQVNEAFSESNKAAQQKIQKIDEARGYASRILNEAGGARADAVLAAMKNPAMTDAQREQLCTELAGTSQEIIAQARAYRTKTVEETKSSAEYLHSLLPEYRKRPQLVVQKIYQDAIEEVMQAAQEKMVIQSPSDKARELRILINRDPSIPKQAATTPQPGRN